MPAKEIALDVAAFLDSTQARALEAPREDVKRIAEAFLAVCYDDLGKAPHKMDGHDAHEAVGHGLPHRLRRKDPAVEHVPAILEAFVAHLEETHVVNEAYEIRRGIDSAIDELQEVVRTGSGGHHHDHAPQKPFVHQAEKTGRNDPCPCGSGKKFKKCHGKAS